MKQILSILLSCLFLVSAISLSVAQDNIPSPKIDSLEQVIANAKHDSTIVNAYYDLGYAYRPDINKSASLYLKADSICAANLENTTAKLQADEKAFFESLRARINTSLGHKYKDAGRLGEAITYYDKAAELYQNLNDDDGLTSILQNRSIVYFFAGQMDKAKEGMLDGLEIHKKNNNSKGIAAFLGNLGTIHLGIGDIETATDYLEQGVAAAEKGGHQSEAAIAMTNLAGVYKDQGDYDKAIRTLIKTIEIFKELGIKSNALRACANLGGAYEEQGNLSKSIQQYTEALRIAEEIDDKTAIGGVLNAISGAYVSLKDYDKALEYAQRSLDENLKTEMKNDIAQSYYGLGAIYVSKGDTEKGMEHYKKSLEVAGEVNDQLIIANVSQNLGNNYGFKKNYTEAKKYLNKAVDIYSSLREQVKYHSAKSDLADVILDEGDANAAIKIQKETLAAGKEMGLLFLEKDAFDGLYKAYKKKGNQKEALQMYEKYIVAKDSLVREEDEKEVIRQEFKYNYDKQALADSIQYAQATRLQDAELAAEKATVRQQKQQSYFLLGGLALAMLMGGFIYNRYRLTQRQKTIIEEQKKQVDQSNLQLQQLNATKDKFFGIIAHDIRSPIVALDGVGDMMDYYVEKDDKPKLKQLAGRVEGTAKQLGGLLDNLLNWALLQQGVIPYNPISLSVKEAADNTLEMFRNNADAKGVNLVADINPELRVNADESALNTILRNLVSNAIKFTPSGGTVSVGAEEVADKVYIHINDTGTGISAMKLKKLFSLEKKSEKGTDGEKGTGLGLTLVKELAELNKGILDVTSTLNKGSKFSVALPRVS